MVINLFLVLTALLVSSSQDSTGAIRVFVVDQESGFPIGSAALFLEGSYIGGRADSYGVGLIPEAPAGICSLRVVAVGYGRGIVEPISVQADRIVEVFAMLPPSMTDGSGLIYIDPSAVPSPDTLAIGEWTVCTLDSLSVASGNSRRAVQFGGPLLLAPSAARTSQTDIGIVGPFVDDGLLTVAPFSSHTQRQGFGRLWNGELGLDWHQSEPTEPAITSVRIQCRTAKTAEMEFGEWSPWCDDIEDLNWSGMLDSVCAVQVRLHLHTEDAAYTPIVTEVRMIRHFI